MFMLWLQIMQENIDEFNLAVYASIVPGFASPIDKINVSSTYRQPKAIEYIISCVSGQGNSQGLFNASLENENGKYFATLLFFWNTHKQFYFTKLKNDFDMYDGKFLVDVSFNISG